MDHNHLLFALCAYLLAGQTLGDMVVSTGAPPSSAPPSDEASGKPAKPEMYSLHVESRISYRYAKTAVISRLANPAGKAQEVFFSMVLPDTAFIAGFNIEVGGKVYEAYVKEKEEAKQEYDQAVASGQTAAHVAVSARDSNTFTVSVNVEPKEKVTFNLTYEELLTRRLTDYNQVINLNPGQVVRDLKVDVYIKESRNITTLRVPEFRTGNEIDANEANKTNSIATIDRTSANEAHVHFAPTQEQQKELAKKKKDGEDENNSSENKGLGGQFVVQYDVDREPQGGEVLVNEGYFVHFFAPSNLSPLHKHVIFVLDVSGSMEGRKVEQLKEAMMTILDDLNPGDYFNLLEFSYSVTVWNLDSKTANLVFSPYNSYDNREVNKTNVGAVPAFPATPEYVKKAKEIVSNMTAGGGTNIHDALGTAITVGRTGLENTTFNGSRPEPIIVFLTDGEPTVGETRPSKLYTMVSERNEHPMSAIFSLAFGDDADFGFLKKVSLKNSGFARKIYEAADAALQLRDFYKQVASPLLANVTFKYDPDKVDAKSVTKKLFPIFFSGSEFVVAGKLTDQNQASDLSAEVSGHAVSGSSLFTIDHPSLLPDLRHPHNKKHASSLERLWAFITIQQLLEDYEANSDDIIDDTKNDTEAHNKTEKTKKKALELALEYSFVTKLTSLVVVKPNETTSAGLESSKPGFNSNTQHRTQLFSKGKRRPTAVGTKTQSAATGNFNRGGSVPLFVAGPPASAGSFGGGFAPARPASFGGFTTGPGFPGAPGHPSFAFTTTRVYPSTTSVPPLHVASLNDLQWLADVSNGSDSLSVPLANGTEIYKLGLDEPDTPFQECSLPDPSLSSSSSSHCRHLPHCVLSAIVHDVHEYAKYFCSIGDFAGVCCPDGLHSPTPGPTTSTTQSS